MENWKNEKAVSLKKWSDKFIDEIRSILGKNFIKIGSMEEDLHNNTDLLYCTDVAFSCRVRKFNDLKYSDEIVIRCKVASGNETEFDKIIAGWGDYIFYGFANETETGLCKWIIGDLKKFRTYVHKRKSQREYWSPQIVDNGDGSKGFAFKLKEIDEYVNNFIIEKYEEKIN